MRILFLSQLLPLPLDAGPKIRAHYVLRYLAEAGHDVTLLCFVRPDDRPADVDALKRFCTAVETVPLRRSRWADARAGLRSLASRTPFLIGRDWLPAMEARRRAVMARHRFDAVHADQLWMAAYASVAAETGLRVLDQHNAVYKVPERMAVEQPNPLVRALLTREAANLAAFEREALRRFDHVVWVSAEDRRAFGPVTGSPAKQPVIPIAVDPGAQPPARRASPFRVTFLGGLHWPPNAEGVRWFADEVWPAVARAVPGAVFTVIGKSGPRPAVRPDASARIEVTGYVDDVRRHVEETAAFVVPIRAGAGMRVKILDAWCWGLPVVSTTIGAEGLAATHGDQLLIADDAATFAEELTRVLGNDALAARLSAGGRAHVEAHYDWRTVYRAWDQVYH